MRIWSLHPQYLDTKGLVALWRETLLAKNVLENKTRAYENHPHLDRFKASKYPRNAINYYLKLVWLEAESRNYCFNMSKFKDVDDIELINVTLGQLKFERSHLVNKLKVRDEKKCNELIDLDNCKTHPLFNIIDGGIEPWEKM